MIDNFIRYLRYILISLERINIFKCFFKKSTKIDKTIVLDEVGIIQCLKAFNNFQILHSETFTRNDADLAMLNGNFDFIRKLSADGIHCTALGYEYAKLSTNNIDRDY
jgi:hypothetical protein